MHEETNVESSDVAPLSQNPELEPPQSGVVEEDRQMIPDDTTTDRARIEPVPESVDRFSCITKFHPKSSNGTSYIDRPWYLLPWTERWWKPKITSVSRYSTAESGAYHEYKFQHKLDFLIGFEGHEAHIVTTLLSQYPFIVVLGFELLKKLMYRWTSTAVLPPQDFQRVRRSPHAGCFGRLPQIFGQRHAKKDNDIDDVAEPSGDTIRGEKLSPINIIEEYLPDEEVAGFVMDLTTQDWLDCLALVIHNLGPTCLGFPYAEDLVHNFVIHSVGRAEKSSGRLKLLKEALISIHRHYRIHPQGKITRQQEANGNDEIVVEEDNQGAITDAENARGRAYLNLDPRGWSLSSAVKYDSPELVSLLMKYANSQPNQLTDEALRALSLSGLSNRSGDNYSAECLKKSKDDENQEEETEHRHFIINLLIKRGLDVNKKFAKEYARKDDPKVTLLSELLNSNTVVWLRDKKALRSTFQRRVLLLCEAGAELTYENQNEENCLELILKTGQASLGFEILRRYPSTPITNAPYLIPHLLMCVEEDDCYLDPKSLDERNSSRSLPRTEDIGLIRHLMSLRPQQFGFGTGSCNALWSEWCSRKLAETRAPQTCLRFLRTDYNIDFTSLLMSTKQQRLPRHLQLGLPSLLYWTCKQGSLEMLFYLLKDDFPISWWKDAPNPSGTVDDDDEEVGEEKEEKEDGGDRETTNHDENGKKTSSSPPLQLLSEKLPATKNPLLTLLRSEPSHTDIGSQHYLEMMSLREEKCKILLGFAMAQQEKLSTTREESSTTCPSASSPAGGVIVDSLCQSSSKQIDVVIDHFQNQIARLKDETRSLEEILTEVENNKYHYSDDPDSPQVVDDGSSGDNTTVSEGVGSGGAGEAANGVVDFLIVEKLLESKDRNLGAALTFEHLLTVEDKKRKLRRHVLHRQCVFENLDRTNALLKFARREIPRESVPSGVLDCLSELHSSSSSSCSERSSNSRNRYVMEAQTRITGCSSRNTKWGEYGFDYDDAYLY